jgi:hypothetical protein
LKFCLRRPPQIPVPNDVEQAHQDGLSLFRFPILQKIIDEDIEYYDRRMSRTDGMGIRSLQIVDI